MKKSKVWYCDFETTTKEPCEVWLWAMYDGETSYTGYNIESFIEKVDSMPPKDTFEFFNLSFDGSFILNYLLKQGMTMFKRKFNTIHNYKEEYKDYSIETQKGKAYQIYHNIENYKYPIAVKKQFPPQIKIEKGEYNTGISMGSWYVLDFNITGTVRKIRDTRHYTTQSIRYWGNVFNFPKGDTPLLETKPKEILPEWEKYVIRDVQIQYEASKLLNSKSGINGKLVGGMTIASRALNAFKQSVGGPETFKTIYPVDVHNALFSLGYRGGFTMGNPNHYKKELQNVYGYDIVSSYPNQMYNKPLPYGIPKEYNHLPSLKTDKLYIIEGIFNIKVKPGMWATILINKSGYPDEYAGILQLTSVDYLRMLKNYDVTEQNIIKVYEFDASSTNFRPYIDYFIQWKNNCKKGDPEREIPKLFLNSLYGKFGTKPTGIEHIPYLKDNKLKFKLATNEKSSVYMPLACFVTAWAREQLFEQIDYVGYDNFVYADTDSIYCLKPLNDTAIGKHLGAWELEKVCTKFCCYRPKTYKYEDNEGHVTVKACGVNAIFEGKTYEEINLQTGSKHIVRRSRQVEGGKLIYDTNYTVSK